MKSIFYGLCVAALLTGLAGCRSGEETPPAETPPSLDTTTAMTPDRSVDIVAEADTVPLSEYERLMQQLGLVQVQSLDSSIRVDLKYSTTDNFVGVDVYGDLDDAYLQEEPARRLVEAQRLLHERHPDYHLLIYDAARPRQVQWILWDTLQKPEADKPKYVADPRKGSIHNFGAAVDLTIVGADGKPLDMGTGYDHFGILAFPYHEDSLLKSGQLTETQIANRHLLREVMQAAGFSPITSEWWHFDAFSRAEARRRYPIIE